MPTVALPEESGQAEATAIVSGWECVRPACKNWPYEKSFSSANSPILACSTLRSTGGADGAASVPNTSTTRLLQPGLPLGDLVGVYIVLAGQLGQRFFATGCRQGHFRFKGG